MNYFKGRYLSLTQGPEAFFEAQDEAYKYMEERFYPTFILSDCYHKMISHADRDGVDFDQPDAGVGVYFLGVLFFWQGSSETP